MKISHPIGAVVLALGVLASAQANSYTSPALVHNFTGNGTCCNIDSTYAIFNDQSGWYNFGTVSNPLPDLLSSIDPNFNTKYQIDSITISLHQKFGGPSAFENWFLDIGDGGIVNGVASSLQVGSTDYQNFTLSLTENVDAFNLAVAGVTGKLQFKLRETTSLTDSICVFNTSAVVNYSDAPVTVVPLPAAAPLFMGGLTLLGFAGLRKSRRSGAAK